MADLPFEFLPILLAQLLFLLLHVHILSIIEPGFCDLGAWETATFLKQEAGKGQGVGQSLFQERPEGPVPFQVYRYLKSDNIADYRSAHRVSL